MPRSSKTPAPLWIMVKLNEMSSGNKFSVNDTVRRVLARYGAEYLINDLDNDGSMFLTFKPHRNAMHLALDDTLKKYLGSIVHEDEHDYDGLIMYEWDIPKQECNRCGICCMFSCGFDPINNNAYGTPISAKIWPGKGDLRCQNLQFDDVEGSYSCAMVKKRSHIYASIIYAVT